MIASRLSALVQMTDAINFAPLQHAAGRAWVNRLPSLVDSACGRWNLDVEDAPLRHGFSAVVVPVRREHTLLTLKLAWPESRVEDEARALHAWNGRGMVLLLDADLANGVLLLERLDAERTLFTLPPLEAAAVAGRLLRRLAIPAPPAFRDVRAVTAELARSLEPAQRRLGSPVPDAWLRQAVRLARYLTGHAGNSLLIHCDLHYDNILAGSREPWLAIDPRAIAGEPEQAVPELLWTRISPDDPAELVLRLLETLVECGALDVHRAREWVIVRCVDYWLWGLGHGLTEDPARCRTILEAVL